MRGHTGEVQQSLDLGLVKWFESELGGKGDDPVVPSHGGSVEGDPRRLRNVESADDAVRVTASVSIPAHELEWRFGPSGGPGGQHANRAHTRAEVRFDIESSPSLTEGQRNRLMKKFGSVVVVSADDERSQLRNRRLAVDRLRLRLADALVIEKHRRPTRPGRGAVERRLDAKRRQASRKQDRRPNLDD